MSVDHLRTDGMSAGVIFLEIHMMYAVLLESLEHRSRSQTRPAMTITPSGSTSTKPL